MKYSGAPQGPELLHEGNRTALLKPSEMKCPQEGDLVQVKSIVFSAFSIADQHDDMMTGKQTSNKRIRTEGAEDHCS